VPRKAILFVICAVIVASAVALSSDRGRWAADVLISYIFDTGPPAIAGKVPADVWMHSDKARDYFTGILRRRFPKGSSAAAMVAVLKDQGFTARDDVPKHLQYSWGHIPCGYFAVVDWSEDAAGRIVHIEGSISEGCL